MQRNPVTIHSVFPGLFSAHLQFQLLQRVFILRQADFRAEAPELFIEVLIAAQDLADVVDGGDAFRCQPREDQRRAGPKVRGHQIRAF